jgi:hypothetical protein
MSAAGESGLRIVIATCAGGQRTTALDDMLVETTPNLFSSSWSGAAGEHGDVRIRRKETCARRTGVRI